MAKSKEIQTGHANSLIQKAELVIGNFDLGQYAANVKNPRFASDYNREFKSANASSIVYSTGIRLSLKSDPKQHLFDCCIPNCGSYLNPI